MRTVILGIFILGLLSRAIQADVNLSVKDIAFHECLGESKGQITLVKSIQIDDPLASSTCSDSNVIVQIAGNPSQ